MSFRIDPSEQQSTSDLIRDFATNEQVSVEQVFKLSWSRFNVIEGDIENVKLFKRLIDDTQTHIDFKILPQVIHFYMYEDLFTFAGKYRSAHDPGQGRIYYGPQLAHQRRPRFRGDPPNKIEQGVEQAIEYLNQTDPEAALMSALKFYQKFVSVHPFYDGNGRIGRLIANIYLAEFELTISWSEFDGKSQFIRKLNRCHLTGLAEAFAVLHKYVNKYVFSFDELEDDQAGN